MRSILRQGWLGDEDRGAVENDRNAINHSNGNLNTSTKPRIIVPLPCATSDT